MEILGVGPTELFFIFIIALILLGPKDMQKTGRTIGVWLNKVVTSDWWRVARDTSRELSQLPTRLMREANLAEAELRQTMAETKSTSYKPDPRPASAAENTIAPPGSQPLNTEAGEAAGAEKKPDENPPKKTNDA